MCHHALASAALAALGALGTACSSSSSAPHGERRTTTASASTTVVTSVPSGSAWTTYGGGVDRRSNAVGAPAPAATPARLWTSAVDGAVYGQPLVFDGLVLVGTEADTVYAFDAGTGAMRWSVHLGTPVPAGALQCGNITPVVGITSTMVLDPASGMLFASAAAEAGGAVHHVLAAVAVSTHSLAWSIDLDQPGWSAPAQLQRAGLALAGGHVLVGFGGNYGDCGRYNGWVLGVPETGSGPVLTYRVPSAREGAVWAPGGITVDRNGTVFVATGNGSAGPGDAFDHGNAVIRLGPTLAAIDYFAPEQWAQDSAADLDLGSTPPIALGDGRLFIVGKQATGYLLSAASLGGIGHPLAAIALCNSRGANAYDAPRLFVVCNDDGTVVRVAVGLGSTLTRSWTWHSPTGGAGSPTVAGGVVWSVDPGSSVLYGIDEQTGATRYSVRLDTGRPTNFAAVADVGGTLYVAGSGAVEALH
jgi:outer membrane protein assembly factor BamB